MKALRASHVPRPASIGLLLLFLLIAYCLTPAAASAAEKAWVFQTYTVSTAGVTTYESGNTSASKATTSGVSLMARRYGEQAKSVVRPDVWTADISETSGLFSARILELRTADIHRLPHSPLTGTTDYSSGTTAWFWVKTAEKNEDSAWSQADMIPVFPSTAISGNSTVPSFFRAQGNFMRAYMQPSGITPFGLSRLEIASVSPPRFFDQTTIIVSADTFTMPVGGSGVSQFTAGSIGAFPGGIDVGYFELVSGTSCYYTTNGTAPAAGTAHVLYKGTVLPLSKVLSKYSQWKAGADACVVRYRFQTRKEE